MKNAQGLIDVIAGAGMGGLLGVLIGLSSSPVVGVLVGALSALLVTFFGLREPAPRSPDDATTERPAPGRSQPLRVAGFGLACLGGVALGLAARTHAWLSPTPKRRVDEWAAAGYSKEQSLRLVAYTELGWDLLGDGAPRKDTAGKKEEPGKERPPRDEPAATARLATTLFADRPADTGDCATLGPARFASATSAAEAFHGARDRRWGALADLVRRRFEGEERQLEVLLLVRDWACDRQP